MVPRLPSAKLDQLKSLRRRTLKIRLLDLTEKPTVTKKKNLTTYSLCKSRETRCVGLSRTSGEETNHGCPFTTRISFKFFLIKTLVNSGDAVDGTNGEESREAEDAAVPADATTAVTENGADATEPHVNGNGKCDENAEADCKLHLSLIHKIINNHLLL